MTRNKVTISALVIFRIKDGLVVEEIEEADMLGLYQQLGMGLKPKAAVKSKTVKGSATHCRVRRPSQSERPIH